MPKARVIEHSIVTHAPASAVFAQYRDVASWSEWDPDTASSWIDGDFRVGATGRLVPAKGLGVPMTITQVTPDRSFTAESRIPILHMRFVHGLTPLDSGVEITHRVELAGAMLWLIGRSLSRQIDEGLPVTLANLKHRVEALAAKQGSGDQL